jgi:hypothetical protein
MRGRLLIAVVTAALAACGLGVVGTGVTTTGDEQNAGPDAGAADGKTGASDDGAAGVIAVDGGDAAPCATCSATCATACAGVCSSNSVCLAGASPACVSDCWNDCGNRKDCTVCDKDGGQFNVCGDSTCSVGAFTCPCNAPGDCPDERDVCVKNKCVRCGYGGTAGGTANLNCKCSQCNGTSCDGC